MTQQLANLDFGGIARVVNLLPGVADHEPATMAQLNAQISGMKWKNSVRVSTQSNLSLAAPGATIDGITMASGDRVLVRAQTTASQNGIYIWTGAATPMTRSADADAFNELEGASTTVEEGTNAGIQYRQSQVNGTIDTNDIVWVTMGSAAPNASESTAGLIEIATQAEVNTGTDDQRALTPAKLRAATWFAEKFTAQFGDGSATQYDIVHSLNTRDIIAQIRQTNSPYELVNATIQALDANTARVIVAAAPTSNQYTISIIG